MAPKRRAYGCIALRDVPVRSVLMTRVRWSRAGFKTAFHYMTGKDTTPQNRGWECECSWAELEILSADFEALWAHPLVPPDWMWEGTTNLKEVSRVRHGHLVREDANRELSRRAAGGAAVPMSHLTVQPLSLPKGGKQSPDEPDWHCALRELQEEAGLDLPPGGVTVEWLGGGNLGGSSRYEEAVFFPVALPPAWEAVEGWPTDRSHESSEALWVPMQKARALRLPAAMTQALAGINEGHWGSLRALGEHRRNHMLQFSRRDFY